MMPSTAKKANLNALSLDEKKILAKSIYNSTSYFYQQHHADQLEIDCQPFSDLFRSEIERLLIEKNLVHDVSSLEKLHEHLSDEMRAYHFDDGVNKISTFFYETDDRFHEVYFKFIQFLEKELTQEPFWFQATPTIRIHCPNGENSHHYPRYHTDIGYGHPPEEINIWLPLTPVLEGHGFRILSLSDSKKTLAHFDYHFDAFIDSAINNKAFSADCDTISHPVTTPFGKLFAFDSRCIHTGEPLKSHTRISIDIRIVPLSQYEKRQVDYQGSGRRKMLFQPGHCYHEKSSNEIMENKKS